MTVKELRTFLALLPDEAEVYADGNEISSKDFLFWKKGGMTFLDRENIAPWEIGTVWLP